jgi:heat shock protein HtpX
MLANTTRTGNTSAQTGGRANRGILAALLLPIAATIIRMSISRTREYKADEGAAYLTGHPEWLMDALAKLDGYSRQYTMQRASNQTAHMFIMNPFNGIKGLSQLFATHPSTEDRLKALAKIQQKLQ